MGKPKNRMKGKELCQMSPKANHKNRVSHPLNLQKLSAEFAESVEVQTWKRQTGQLAIRLVTNVLSLLYQREAAQYSLGIPETAARMQSDLSEMVSHTWNIFAQLRTLTYGSPAWKKISPNEREVIHNWMIEVEVLLEDLSGT